MITGSKSHVWHACMSTHLTSSSVETIVEMVKYQEEMKSGYADL